MSLHREPKRQKLEAQPNSPSQRVVHVKEKNAGTDRYCICKQPMGDRRDGNGMIQCIRCKDWFHLSCIGFLTSRRGSGGGYKCDECKIASPEPLPPPPILIEAPKEKRVSIKITCRECNKAVDIAHCHISKKQHRHFTSYLCSSCNRENAKLYCLCRRAAVRDAVMIQCFGCSDWFHPGCVNVDLSTVSQLQAFYCPVCQDNACDGAAPRFCVCKTRYNPKREMFECTKCKEWYHPECIGVSPRASPVGFMCTLCTRNQRLYCICRQPNTVNQRPMIECAGCKSWFHMDCCNVSKQQADSFDLDWECPGCRRGKARSNKIAHANSRRFKKIEKLAKQADKQEQFLQNLAERLEVVELLYPWGLQMEAFTVGLKAGGEDDYTTADEVVECMRCVADEFPELGVHAEAAAQARQELDLKGLKEALRLYNGMALRLGLYNQEDGEAEHKEVQVAKRKRDARRKHDSRERASARQMAHIMMQAHALY